MSDVVLCVDDEELVRDITQTALARGGYRVLLAAGGAEAISLLETTQERISLVLLDWNLPGTDSGRLIERLKQLRPSLKILLVSGHCGSTADSRTIRRQVNGFLAKPYLPRQLVRRVDKVLSGRSRSQ
jgi:CheY-like chemotaxis protein